jgi:flagellar basal-body rod protein FlgB
MDLARVPLFEAMAKRLGWLTERQSLLAQNVANANTPGYAAKDLQEPDFSDLLKKSGGSIHMVTTQSAHLGGGNGGGAVLDKTAAKNKTLGGNSVSLEDQMMKVSTNASDYAMITSLYRQQLSLIKIALGAGG